MNNLIKIYASSSSGNCYQVDNLLLECGLPLKTLQQVTEYGLSDIAACLISHEHADHARSVKDLLQRGVDVYMSQGTRNVLGVDGVNIIKPRQQLQVGKWTILPFETEHDAKEPLGFLLADGRQKVIYATDTYYIRYKFNGLTHIMLECNYSLDILNENVEKGIVGPAVKKRVLRSHFSLENAKSFLKANDLSKVQEIYLLHLSDDNSNEERFKREIQELTGKPVTVAGKEAHHVKERVLRG